MMNPAKLFKLKSLWDAFTKNHPKFPKFLEAVHKNGLEEGTIFEMNVTTRSGKTLSCNLKLKESDIKLFKELSDLFGSM